jgi:Leucine-rich repeat (LRR) protein
MRRTEPTGLTKLSDLSLSSNSLSGSITITRNWLSDEPLDDWYGVTTDAAGRVTSLSLDENSLSGTIPAELGNLTNLRQLDLNNPAELGNLTNLNQLSGTIPAELGSLTNLYSLGLSGNQLDTCPSQAIR